MNTRKGFTLVELLVVIAILAILATVSVVGYTSFITRAEQSNALTEAVQIKRSIETALIADEEVKVADGIFATMGTDGVEFSEEATTEDYKDISGDLAAAGSLEYSNTSEIVYTNTKTGVEVNVIAGTVVAD